MRNNTKEQRQDVGINVKNKTFNYTTWAYVKDLAKLIADLLFLIFYFHLTIFSKTILNTKGLVSLLYRLSNITVF